MSSTGSIEKNNTLESERLLDMDRQFAALSVRSGAAEAFKAFLAEDAIALGDGQQPQFGRDGIYGAMEPKQSNYQLDWEPQQAQVSQSEDMGWTWGTYTLRYLNEGGERKIDHGKYLNVWKRNPDGNWAVAIDMGNSNPAPNEKMNEK